MTLHDHVNYICKRGFFHVRDLFSLRRFLSEDDTNTAAHAFVTSILDYGNSLLHGISVHLIDKLQVLQNSSTRAIKKRRKLEHISEDIPKTKQRTYGDISFEKAAPELWNSFPNHIRGKSNSKRNKDPFIQNIW